MIEQLLNANNLTTNETRLVLIIAGTLLTAIFVLFVVMAANYHRKFLQVQKELTKAEVDTLEKERQRIAGELHDSLGPLLSAVKLQISSLDTQIPDDLELIEKAGGYIDNVMDSIRTVSNSLSPKLLFRKGLVSAVDDLVNNTQTIFPVRISFESGAIPRLSDDYELRIYRIIQEIIHNTVKHAACKQLSFRLFVEKNLLVLLSSDNGKGFDTTLQKDDGKGLGLRNIETRNNILDGRMELISKPGEGTKYVFEFPLNELTTLKPE